MLFSCKITLFICLSLTIPFFQLIKLSKNILPTLPNLFDFLSNWLKLSNPVKMKDALNLIFNCILEYLIFFTFYELKLLVLKITLFSRVE